VNFGFPNIFLFVYIYDINLIIIAKNWVKVKGVGFIFICLFILSVLPVLPVGTEHCSVPTGNDTDDYIELLFFSFPIKIVSN